MAYREIVPDGEAAHHEAVARRLREIQEARAARHPKGRALHYKPIAALRGELVVGDVPEGLRAGIFANPGGRHAVVVRFSNGSGKSQPDATPDVRGIAVKVFDVPGTKLIPPLADATTQDFLAITTEVLPFRTVDEFVTVVEVGELPAWQAPFYLLRKLGFGGTFRLLGDLRRELGTPLAHYAEKPFFSAAPIRWGDTAVKFSLAPSGLGADGIDRGPRDHYGPDLGKRMRAAPLTFALRVQRFVDDTTTPIEDGGVRWPSPWEQVATITLPAQDLDDAHGRALTTLAEAWAFDPWHAPLEFQPLGAVMRARNPAYRESGQSRGAAGEPTVADLPPR